MRVGGSQVFRDSANGQGWRVGEQAGRRLAAAISILFIVFANTFVAGCAVQLAPSYDKAIFDGLTKINEDTMTLFASMSSGAPKATYAKRDAAYNAIIGNLDAVRLQIQARLNPSPPAIVAAVMARPGTSSSAIAEAQKAMTDVPSLGSVETMKHTMEVMRSTDSRHGLSPMLVDGFRRRFEISMEQALVYEKALNR